MRIEDGPIIVEQVVDAPIETVWKSITEIDLMRQWYFENIPSFKAEIGFETQFNVQSGSRNFLHKWKVTDVIPQKMITYNWKYEGYPGDSFVTFELSSQNSLTKLKLTHHVQKSFPDDIPEFTRESCLGGWTFFIKQRLKEFLDE